MALMLVGIDISSLNTANVAAFFVQEGEGDETTQALATPERIEARLDGLEAATREQRPATAPEG